MAWGSQVKKDPEMAISPRDQGQRSYSVTEAESEGEVDCRSAIELALRDPAFYPHPVEKIEIEETHISKVFLTGKFVYKVKKPVDFGFLDFTSLEKRRHCCEQEVLLNQRLSHQVYLDVAAVTLEPGGYGLNGPGEPVEYAVKMRQLPRERTMLEILRRGKLTDAMVQALVQVLASFYEEAPRGPRIDAMGSLEIIETNTEEDFDQTEPFVPSIINPGQFSRIHDAVGRFLNNNIDLFQRRIETGCICDCHGDLRLGHIYFLDHDHFPGGIQIIDCIEFNNRFRYGDVASDLAFLAMDLDYQGFPDVGQRVLTAYAQAANDPEIFLLIEFYKCYRAHIRCKVECLRQAAGDLPAEKTLKTMERAQRYFALAYEYAANFNRPTLWIVCGLIASGKSTIAAELAKRLNVRILSSDVIRKRFFGRRPDGPAIAEFGEGIYSPVATAQTYERMLLAAREELFKGNSVIVDATFGDRVNRDNFRCLAEEKGANVIFVECCCPYSVLRMRLAKRRGKKLITDARLQHLEAQRQVFEPLTELEDDTRVQVETDHPLEENLQYIFSAAYKVLKKQAHDTQTLNCFKMVEEFE
jgi:aminoglycoside phosphotransferase family enzyme/predicted kinase